MSIYRILSCQCMMDYGMASVMANPRNATDDSSAVITYHD